MQSSMKHGHILKTDIQPYTYLVCTEIVYNIANCVRIKSVSWCISNDIIELKELNEPHTRCIIGMHMHGLFYACVCTQKIFCNITVLLVVV